MTHGDTCIGEFVQYRYGYRQGEVACRDPANSCDRALCECDAQFAKAHNAAKDVFTNEYHMFWSTTEGYPMWDPENDNSQCPRGGNGPYVPECCGGNGSPFVKTSLAALCALANWASHSQRARSQLFAGSRQATSPW